MNMKPPSTDLVIKLAIGVAVLGVGYFVVTRGADLIKKGITALPDAVDGVLTGNNFVTQAATNSAGERTTAYQGAGILGTLGAATNTLSGGWFATAGEWIGGKAADIFQPSYNPNPTPTPARSAYWKS